MDLRQIKCRSPQYTKVVSIHAGCLVRRRGSKNSKARDIADLHFERSMGRDARPVEKEAVIARTKTRIEASKARLQKSIP